jgi:hypothetical protein
VTSLLLFGSFYTRLNVELKKCRRRITRFRKGKGVARLAGEQIKKIKRLFVKN